MRVFKGVVILVAIGLLIGFVVLFLQVREQREQRRAEERAGVRESRIPLPAGARVVSVTPHGSGLALLVAGGADQELLLLDRHGRLEERVVFPAGAPLPAGTPSPLPPGGTNP